MGEQPADFMAAVAQTITTATRLKSKMKERGLTRAQTICPRCDGRLDAVLIGPKQHMRLWCSTPGYMQMME